MFPGTASAVSTPPTPFADRESLEAELKALESQGGAVSGALAAAIAMQQQTQTGMTPAEWRAAVTNSVDSIASKTLNIL